MLPSQPKMTLYQDRGNHRKDQQPEHNEGNVLQPDCLLLLVIHSQMPSVVRAPSCGDSGTGVLRCASGKTSCTRAC